MSLKRIKKFIRGTQEGTRLEIMDSKPASKLPDGTPIAGTVTKGTLTPTQKAHVDRKINVHEPQCYAIKEKNKVTYYVGPSIAQEWKLLYQGKRPFYQIDAVETLKDTGVRAMYL